MAKPKPTAAQREHAKLLRQLDEIQKQQQQALDDAQAFLKDPVAEEKLAVQKSFQELLALTPEVHTLSNQTLAVVDRIANANEVAEKMTKEVRRIDAIQSNLSKCLKQSALLLCLRNALHGVQLCLQSKHYQQAAQHLNKLHEINDQMQLEPNELMKMQACESEFKQIVRTNFETALQQQNKTEIVNFGLLFQSVGQQFESEGLQVFLAFVSQFLNSKVDGMQNKSFSTKELMENITVVFNQVAALVQEYDDLVRKSFPHVNGTNRLIALLYTTSENPAVQILQSYMQQRQLMDKMNQTRDQNDPLSPRKTPPTAPPSPPMRTDFTTSALTGSPIRGAGSMGANITADEIAAMNEQLNEIALMIQHTQTYERFMHSRVVERTTVQDPQQEEPTKLDEDDVIIPFLNPNSTSELDKTVQELAGFYCYFENLLLTKAATKAFQWEELRFVGNDAASLSLAASPSASGFTAPGNSAGDAGACYAVSTAIDEIFYVSRNSGLRALATGHADCAAGAINMIGTVLRDILGDNMRFRIRNMASFLKLEHDGFGIGGVNQFRDQMQQQVQQQLAKFSKSMAPLGSGVGLAGLSTSGSSIALADGTTGSVGSSVSSSAANKKEQREFRPEVVLNSLEATVGYIVQLKTQFEHELQQVFPDRIPANIASCLLGLEDSSAELNQLLTACFKKLGKLLEPRLVALLGNLLTSNTKRMVQYELSEQMYTFYEANDPFAQQFAVGLRDLLQHFQPALSRTNFLKLVELLAENTCSLIENWFWNVSPRVNQLGSLQFDKDLRVLTSVFMEFSDCRQLFASLNQIAMVLSVDDPEDVVEFYGRKVRGIEWVLSAARVKELLAVRVEFGDRATTINKLQL